MADHDCPDCQRSFDTRRGVAVHYSSVHDGRLPNRECDACGTSFYSEYEKRYCSDDCREDAVSFEGEANPNYRGGRTTTNCERCGSEFEYYESAKEGVFCPDCVENTDWQTTPTLTGDDNPRWSGGKLTLRCEVCEESFERYPSDVTGEIAVCSEPCRREWLSEEFTGEGHPNWKGGGNVSYGPGWNEVRARALERDGYACVVCGTTASELGRNPDVHHLVPVRVFAESDDHAVSDAHFLDNVVSLCPSCHRKAEFGRISRQRLRAGVPTG